MAARAASFEKNAVHFLQPAREDWFNVFVLHQNRAHHTPKGYVDTKQIDDTMDLVCCLHVCCNPHACCTTQVVWGHEHECLVEPMHVGDGSFSVSQPGSSVATSLSQVRVCCLSIPLVLLWFECTWLLQGESSKKHVGILTLSSDKYKLQSVPLTKVSCKAEVESAESADTGSTIQVGALLPC